MAQTEEFLGTGRRKRAVARVRLADGSGKVTVNGANVVASIRASNGIVHVIDKVLLPPQ